MNLDEGDTVMDVARVVKEDENGNGDDANGGEVISEGRDQRELDV
jgi:hypothetical protein